MPNTLRESEPLLPHDHELERTLRTMNQNMGINNDQPNQKMPAPFDAYGQLLPDDLCESQQRRQNPTLCPQERYKGHDNFVDSDGLATCLAPSTTRPHLCGN